MSSSKEELLNLKKYALHGTYAQVSCRTTHSICDMTHSRCDVTHSIRDMTYFICDTTYLICDTTYLICDMTHSISDMYLMYMKQKSYFSIFSRIAYE